MLNPVKFSDTNAIRDALRQGCLIIENALVPEVAEQLYNDLVHCQQWRQHDHRNDLNPAEQAAQDRFSPDYTFSRETITLGEDKAPESVNRIFDYLRSPEIRSYFAGVSARPCDAFQLSATRFRGGDHIAEHNDYYVKTMPDGSTITRALTFNYYLTKDWRPEWGGRLIWKKPYAEIVPSFNTLVLFRVGTTTHHHVESVTTDAQLPRLALTGWYLSVRKPAADISQSDK